MSVNADRCMFCGNCYTSAPPCPCRRPGDGIALWVGGKVSNSKSMPMFSKLAVPYIPNEPPVGHHGQHHQERSWRSTPATP